MRGVKIYFFAYKHGIFSKIWHKFEILNWHKMQYFAFRPLIFVSGETQVIRFETKKELFFQMIYKKFGVGLKFTKKYYFEWFSIFGATPSYALKILIWNFVIFLYYSHQVMTRTNCVRLTIWFFEKWCLKHSTSWSGENVLIDHAHF